MKKGLSEIIVLLDRSGSMDRISGGTIEGFNKFVTDQKAVEGEANLTLVQFDDVDPHELVHDRVPLDDVPLLTYDTFQPRSMTPLYDALGWAIGRHGRILDAMDEDEKPEHVIVVILTDGLENASREFTREQVFKTIQAQQDEWNWKFIYLGANQDSMAVARGIGVKHDPRNNNVINYAYTGKGVMRGAVGMSAATASYRTSAEPQKGMTEEDQQEVVDAIIAGDSK